MFSPPKLHCSIPASKTFYTHRFVGGQAACRLYTLRLPSRRFLSLSLRFCSGAASEPSQSDFTSTVESSSSLQLSQFNFTGRHIFWLNVIACTVAVSTTWLFFSAIPALLAFKRAAESLEKLLDVTREELPDTMAAVRLSGMEISDLTMELSDLGQEITQGVRNSTRAVRLAEERLRGLTNMSPSGGSNSENRSSRASVS